MQERCQSGGGRVESALRLLCVWKSGKMQPFLFPILERKEILSYLLADTGIILEEQQLIEPTMEAVWPVYENHGNHAVRTTFLSSYGFLFFSRSLLSHLHREFCVR